MSLKLTKTKLSIGLALCCLYIPFANAATFVIERNGQSFAIEGDDESEQLYTGDSVSSNTNQHWVQLTRDDGYYAYKQFGTNLCWDGGDDGSKRQAITLETCDSDNLNQHWEKITDSSGSKIYRFEKRNTSGYSIYSSGKTDGEPVHLWPSDETNAAQKWELTNINDLGITDDISITDDINITSELGIDSSTGYAENYTLTGQEMTLDFDEISWNTVKVKTSSELEAALSGASAGDKIVIASGTYVGNFKLTKGAYKSKPIWIVGESTSNMPILDGDDYNNSTSLAIDGGSAGGIAYVYIQNIKVTNSRTGIAVDQADYVTIDNVEVYDVGQSAIHLRDGSKYNIIKNSYIHDTGLYNVKYGEGVYIGSDYTKWPGGTSSSEYDPAVDYAQILNNKIGPNVTAEHIDVKEGSSHAYIIGNTFDAKGMNDILNGGLSFIDFKGNYAEAAYNTGDQNNNEYFENAFEINEKSNGWGAYNDIHDNTVTFDDKYYDSSNVSVTITLPLGSGGNSDNVKTTNDIKPTHWVVKNNVDGTNTVSNNTRDPKDENKMYTGL
ncbi:RICIN domain-containing protein [Psychromonas sp.]|nr:RICIN domain-containing protein [Psychromonas sp.]